MSDVFVSYASEDRARVGALVRSLEKQGFSVWWDREIAHGENYHRVIEQALDAAKCVVVVWTHDSIASEWVTNEAASAQRRGVLVPVMLEAVEPPLAFRHLQTADLRDEHPGRNSEYDKLERSVRRVVLAVPKSEQRASAPPTQQARSAAAHQESTGGAHRSGASWAVGVGALLLGAAVLLLVLQQLGWIGTTPSLQPQAGASPTAPNPSNADAPRAGPTQTGADTSLSAPPANTPTAPTQRADERMNVLDPEHGAQIVSASQESWRALLESKKSDCTNLNAQSFVTVALRGERGAKFDTLAVYVEGEWRYNLKMLGLYAGENERGPFTKVGEFEIPNYKNMRAPFHEFKFQPVRARFVKLQVLDFHHGEGPNGTVCTLRLLEAG